MARLLVVGVRPGSLGHFIASRATAEGFEVICADKEPADSTTKFLDVTSPADVDWFWAKAPVISSVVYAAGVNEEGSVTDPDWRRGMARQMAVNFAGAIEMLNCWLAHGYQKRTNRHFVTIASNSAHIPRSTGMNYCASKAAVVMAMRCAAREQAQRYPGGEHPSIYTYSPGWLEGTPMSEAVERRIRQKQQGLSLHRIPGGVAVSPAALAQIVVRNLSLGDGRLLNGTDIRLDGGEI